MSVHDGHRQRLRERFLTDGLDHFDEINVLELLLFYCIPRKDTNEIAHKLLDQFGSLPNVLDAPAEELRKVKDIGDNAATFLSLISSVNRYYQMKKAEQTGILTSIEQCNSYLVSKFLGRRNETVYLLCLDAKCKVICCRQVGEGTVNSAGISVRKIVEVALAVNATSVVLAHNHPSGIALPSAEDIHTTQQVANALKAVDVTLVDHIVVADDDYVSLALSGLYRFDNITS